MFDLVVQVDESADGWDSELALEIVITVSVTPIRGTLIPAAIYVQLTEDTIAREMGEDSDAIQGDVRTRALHPRVALQWLVGANSFLDGARPIDVLRLGGCSPVIEALDAAQQGVYS